LSPKVKHAKKSLVETVDIGDTKTTKAWEEDKRKRDRKFEGKKNSKP